MVAITRNQHSIAYSDDISTTTKLAIEASGRLNGLKQVASEAIGDLKKSDGVTLKAGIAGTTLGGFPVFMAGGSLGGMMGMAVGSALGSVICGSLGGASGAIAGANFGFEAKEGVRELLGEGRVSSIVSSAAGISGGIVGSTCLGLWGMVAWGSFGSVGGGFYGATAGASLGLAGGGPLAIGLGTPLGAACALATTPFVIGKTAKSAYDNAQEVGSPYVEAKMAGADQMANWLGIKSHITVEQPRLRLADALGNTEWDVHNKFLTKHYQNQFDRLMILIHRKGITIPSAERVREELLELAKGSPESVRRGIDFLLVQQKNRGVMDFRNRVTGDLVLKMAHAWIQSFDSKIDRKNGLENLFSQLEYSQNHHGCNTRHAEDVLESLEISYGLDLETSATEQTNLDRESLSKSVELSGQMLVDYLWPDILQWARLLYAERGEAGFHGDFEARLEEHIAQTFPALESRATTRSMTRYLHEAWDSFLEAVGHSES